MENGRAGSARLKMARNMRVRQRPIKMATKQANVVFQSPYEEALPTCKSIEGEGKLNPA